MNSHRWTRTYGLLSGAILSLTSGVGLALTLWYLNHPLAHRAYGTTVELNAPFLAHTQRSAFWFEDFYLRSAVLILCLIVGATLCHGAQHFGRDRPERKAQWSLNAFVGWASFSVVLLLAYLGKAWPAALDILSSFLADSLFDFAGGFIILWVLYGWPLSLIALLVQWGRLARTWAVSDEDYSPPVENQITDERRQD